MPLSIANYQVGTETRTELCTMFGGAVNPTTGKLEWVEQERDVNSEEADISRELARSQYGDMLYDKGRNRLYYRALESAVEEVKASGREAHVLDIGTGTGLLAMMAARAGASKVTACEVLRPMVKIARQVIARNGYTDVIRIVAKRSTEMTEKDMPTKANILVTEVFDTELIGEGALVTFAHAHQHLLEAGCIVIPSSSKMYVRLIESDFLWNAHKLVPEKIAGGINLPPAWDQCAGPPSVWDLHVEEIKVPEQMKKLSPSIKIASFQFSDPNLSPDSTSTPVEVPIVKSGVCHGLVVWWDIELGSATLTMDPFDYQQWRDHWLQAVYLWPQPVPLNGGEVVTVALNHDDYSIWFAHNRETSSSPSSLYIERPLCTCGVHTACSRTRVSMYNNVQRNTTQLELLKKVLVGRSTVLCVSDGSLIPLLLAKAKADIPSLKNVYALESSSHCYRVTNELLQANNLSSAVTVLNKPFAELNEEDLAHTKIDAIVGEPFFSFSLLPWHNLHFWYAVNGVRRLTSPDCLIVPGKASLKAIAVNFEHMYKMRAPVGTVEGFDISAFDKAVGKYTTTEQGVEAEPHPVWEYVSYPRSEVHDVMTFDLTSCIQKTTLTVSGDIQLNEQCRTCHGVVLWMDYGIGDDVFQTTGLLKEPNNMDEKLAWDPCYKQAVYFLPPNFVNQSLVSLKYNVCFTTQNGNLDMQFIGIH